MQTMPQSYGITEGNGKEAKDGREEKTKICPQCKKEKKLEFFYRNSNRPEGHDNICKMCRRLTNRQYYNKIAWGTRGKLKEFHDKYNNDIEFRVEYLKKRHEWYWKHRDEINERRRWERWKKECAGDYRCMEEKHMRYCKKKGIPYVPNI